MPLLSLITVFVFPIFLYWKVNLRKYWFYNEVSSINEATHIYIEGAGKLVLPHFSYNQPHPLLIIYL